MSHHTKFISIVLVAAMIFMSGAFILDNASAALPSGWNGGTITNNERSKTASVSDCFMDANNKLHVVYAWLDNSSGVHNNYLMYTDNTGGAWSTPVQIDTLSANLLGASIAVNSLGKSYVTYVSSDHVKVATNSGGGWSIATVDAANSNSDPSIAIDHSNNVHIAYTEINQTTSNWTVLHASNTAGNWKNETVAILPSGNEAAGTSIAVDTANHLTIAYVNYSAPSSSSTGNIIVVTNANGSWQPTQIDSTGAASGILALTLDHNNRAHVLFTTTTGLAEGQNRTLKYANNTKGAWTTQTVTNLNGFAYQYGGQILVDGSNRPIICYVNVTLAGGASSSVFSYFQTNVRTLISGVWNNAAIPLALYPSMAITSTNNLTVVYLGYSSLAATNASALLYATTGIATMPPSAPIDFGISNGNGRVALTWSAPTSNGGRSIIAYNIYRGLTAASTTLLTSVGAASYTYLDTGLTNGVRYYYHVAAVTALGIGTNTTVQVAQPSTVQDPTAVPGPVTGVIATAGDGKVTLNWNSSSTGGPVSYQLVYRSTGTEQPTTSQTNLTATTTQYVDTAVSNGLSYYYWIVPANANGAGHAASTGAVTPTGKPVDNTLLYAIIAIIAIIIVAVVLLLIVRRRRNK